MEDTVRPLSEIPAINRFLNYCRVRTVPAKTVMIHAGDLPDVMYYIVSGSVEVMIDDEDGNEIVLAYLNKGQFFGEMGLFYGQPTRSAWVRTRAESKIAEMTYPRFRQIASESPGLIFELATQLAARLDRTNPGKPCPNPRRRRHRTCSPRDHGPLQRTRCHDPSGRNADQGLASGTVETRRLFTRDGGSRPEGARGTRTRKRPR